MFIYADAQACPGCRSPLRPPALSCAACGLVLTGPAPRRVFETLQHVDTLVAGLYAAANQPTQPTQPAQPAQPTAPVLPPAPRSALSSASVPRILLGLGALCLLVAALVFLAVAWAALGVDGRTVVLGGFTLVSGALTAWVARRDLRAGAEALSAVTLGLSALVLGGAWRAGWLGTLGDGPFLLVAGVVVAAAAVGTARWAGTTPVVTLISPEVIATLGLVAAAIGMPDTIQQGSAVAALAALAILASGAVAGHLLGLRVLLLGAGGGAALCWLLLTSIGVGRVLGNLDLAHLWGDLEVWPLLVATVLVAAVAAPGRLPMQLRVPAAAVAVLLGTLVGTAASFDESPTSLALTELAVVAAYALLATRLPGAWKWVCAAPSVIASLGLAVSVIRLTAVALGELVLNEPWSRGVLERVDAPDVPWTWPLLLPAGILGISLTIATVLYCNGRQPRIAVVPGAAALVVALALMPGLYGAPLAVSVAAVLVATAALAIAAGALGRVDLGVAAAASAVLALLAGLANDWVTAGVLAAFTAAAVGAEATSRSRVGGAFLAPLTGAGLIWTIGHLADVDISWRALPVLLVLGVAVVLRPVFEREVATAAAAALAVAGSVLGAGGFEESWLAVYLTVAGVIATASSLLNPTRRRLAWLGLALLTLAQWVRLQELGIGTVEAYTLPLALVLLTVGTVTLLRGTGSSLSALAPGLALALVPTLLQVLVDPLGLRAVLLGLGCLLLVVIGLVRGWAAPLLAGAAVGALLVLRQATLAQVIPQWVLIGLVGVVLTVVGVTWEQRLQQFHKVSAYVRGLR